MSSPRSPRTAREKPSASASESTASSNSSIEQTVDDHLVVLSGPIAGMEYRRLEIRGADYLVAGAGTGPPVLLLHGFPQTHFCWRGVVPVLSQRHTVVAPDLRGYGGTAAPAGGPRGEGFGKRDLANDLVELMSALGFDRFAVVGHDRGPRV